MSQIHILPTLSTRITLILCLLFLPLHSHQSLVENPRVCRIRQAMADQLQNEWDEELKQREEHYSNTVRILEIKRLKAQLATDTIDLTEKEAASATETDEETVYSPTKRRTRQPKNRNHHRASARKKRQPAPAKSRRARYGPVNRDPLYASIIELPEEGVYGALACCFCKANSSKKTSDRMFFSGVPGLLCHISQCLENPSHDPYTQQMVLESSVCHRLTPEEKKAVDDGDHARFSVPQILANGARRSKR